MAKTSHTANDAAPKRREPRLLQYLTRVLDALPLRPSDSEIQSFVLFDLQAGTITGQRTRRMRLPAVRPSKEYNSIEVALYPLC